jgi:Schlafen, AlbA_2
VAMQKSDLDELLSEPRETLDVEVKQWLDLSDPDHRALVAKEIIALANHGGGYLVIGFEELTNGTFAPASPRPTNLDAWSQDAIQSIVAKYIDPNIQCRVVHRSVQQSEGQYPIIMVPGGHRVPIRARAGSPDGKRLIPHRVYVRRPGPTSEEPKTAEEWDRFLERCLQNRQAELLEAMRSIMAGVIPVTSQKTESPLAKLRSFEDGAIARWEKRVSGLPTGVAPTFPLGYHDVGMAIDGAFKIQTLRELRQTIDKEVRNHSGWPAFVTINREPFAPKPVEGAVEFWRGPDNDGSYSTPDHHDFWRISPEGLFFTRRGYSEDGEWRGMPPGKYFDISTPTRRLGEAILQAVYIARALSAIDANLICRCQWSGLAGRRLISRGNPNRDISDRYATEQDAYEATQTAALGALPQSLPELIYSILAPLYELFDFFPLPKRLVEEELASLQLNRF